VKLVAEIGIGTIAAGVAKANADVDPDFRPTMGGTGALRRSSFDQTRRQPVGAGGSPKCTAACWSMVLRDRVLLRTDAASKTGWDVLMAALLGAEEYGFGSVSMIAEGCINGPDLPHNNCPVGVALAKRSPAQALHRPAGACESHFFLYVAEEVRQLLRPVGVSPRLERSDRPQRAARARRLS